MFKFKEKAINALDCIMFCLMVWSIGILINSITQCCVNYSIYNSSNFMNGFYFKYYFATELGNSIPNKGLYEFFKYIIENNLEYILIDLILPLLALAVSLTWVIKYIKIENKEEILVVFLVFGYLFSTSVFDEKLNVDYMTNQSLNNYAYSQETLKCLSAPNCKKAYDELLVTNTITPKYGKHAGKTYLEKEVYYRYGGTKFKNQKMIESLIVFNSKQKHDYLVIPDITESQIKLFAPPKQK